MHSTAKFRPILPHKLLLYNVLVDACSVFALYAPIPSTPMPRKFAGVTAEVLLFSAEVLFHFCGVNGNETSKKREK